MKKSLKLTQQFLILVLILTGNSFAGVFGDRLQEKLQSKSGNDTIHVWIKLPDVIDSESFKKNLNKHALSPEDRYKSGLAELKNKHYTAQKDLVKGLRNSVKNGKVKNIKQHWMTNVVETDISVDELQLLSLRNDIEKIILPPEIVAITPSFSSLSPDKALVGIPKNISLIKAPQAWAAGYTGKGRVVCSFDTGVEGNHPALYNNWKGHDGDSSAAWFDPKYNEPFPHTFHPSDGYSEFNVSHGSHTMGIMVGHDDAAGDTIGVAPGAKWISAGVLDIVGVSLLDAFEWAANPDGNPNTVADIPDVINHSWGVKDIGCEEIYYNFIDHTEALGIVNIFAAGNEGPLISSIRNPSNRALDSLDCFAVGSSTQDDTPIILDRSSRGPSDCNGAIKPNVTAPGYTITSSIKGGIYGKMDGTSMAAPHVSGLVALLREKNPNATVDQIKTAILNSARDFGRSLPDNNYGWGVIDCIGALNALSSVNNAPNLRVYDFDHNSFQPGDTVAGSLVLQNLGKSITSVNVSIVGSDPLLQVISGAMNFGNFNEGDTVSSDDSLKVVVSASALNGSLLPIEINIAGAGYAKTSYVYLQITPAPQKSFVTHSTGRINFSISNYGMFGFANGSYTPQNGAGFKYFDGTNDLYEGGIMVAYEKNYVADAVHDAICESDVDFTLLPDGDISISTDGQVAPEETESRFTDRYIPNRSGLEITQRTYAFNDAGNQDYIIMKYHLRNSRPGRLNKVYFGIYLDWDILNVGSNSGGYDYADKFLWTAYRDANDKLLDYRGIKILNGNPSSLNTQTIKVVGCDGDGFTETEKINALSAGIANAATYQDSTTDINQIAAVGPIDFGAGDEYTAVFAVLAGDDKASIIQAARAAKAKYESSDILTDVNDEVNDMLPDEFTLSQNYPNPFNPKTSIEFTVPHLSNVAIEIYNVLGQQVRTLTDKQYKAGKYIAEWDGADNNGSQTASGIYLYRLKTENVVITKKMLLLK